MPYFSSFVTKSWLNVLEDLGQGQRSLCMTHPLMLIIISAKYRKNPFRTVEPAEGTDQDVPYFSSWKFMAEWPRRYRSRSKVIMRDTPSRVSDRLCVIWKESIQNCRSYRVDTAWRTDRVKALYPPTTLLCMGYKKFLILSLQRKDHPNVGQVLTGYNMIHHKMISYKVC